MDGSQLNFHPPKRRRRVSKSETRGCGVAGRARESHSNMYSPRSRGGTTSVAGSFGGREHLYTDETDTMSVSQSTRRDTVEGGHTAEVELSPHALLDVLDADYTEAILEAIHEDAKPARALVEECGASRPTIYRRLNTLQEAGLVESRMTLERDGHHRTVFEARFDSISIDVADDGLSVSVSRTEPAD